MIISLGYRANFGYLSPDFIVIQFVALIICSILPSSVLTFRSVPPLLLWNRLGIRKLLKVYISIWTKFVFCSKYEFFVTRYHYFVTLISINMIYWKLHHNLWNIRRRLFVHLGSTEGERVPKSLWKQNFRSSSHFFLIRLGLIRNFNNLIHKN